MLNGLNERNGCVQLNSWDSVTVVRLGRQGCLKKYGTTGKVEMVGVVIFGVEWVVGSHYWDMLNT